VGAQSGDLTQPPLSGLQLNITSPFEGQRFGVGVPVSIQATTVDPQGAVLRLEFLAEGRLIGVSEIFTLVEVPPGTPVAHEFLWKDAPAGAHRLAVRAQDGNEFGAVSAPVSITVEIKVHSSLDFEAPAEGAVFLTPGRVPMTVVAVDPASEIRRVEFFADEQQLGVSEILTRDAIFPGRPRTHSFTWTNPPPGAHVLHARARDSMDQKVTTAPRNIRVKGDPAVPVASLVISQPVAGAEFLAGSIIELQAIAIDPVGSLRRVEFFANERSLGVSEITTEEVDVPGWPRVHRLTWEAVPAGDFKLWARTTTAAGIRVESEVVPVRVVESGGKRPTVTIWTGKSPAFETGDMKTRTAVFEISRTGGDLTSPVSVFLQLGGTAVKGVDYQVVDLTQLDPAVPLDGSSLVSVLIPGGQSTTPLMLLANSDTTLEGTETVVATLVESPLALIQLSPLSADYLIGTPHEAGAEIRDSAVTEASLVMVTPAEGDRFQFGEKITIDTVGQDPHGLVTTVEFFANGERIGEYCFLCLVDGIFPPGTPLLNALIWTPAKPGEYVLTAVGQFGPDRKVESTPVRILVHEGEVGPRLTITHPVSDSVVSPHELNRVVAVGVGRFGGITDVELLLDGRRIAESHLSFFRPPEADEKVAHVFEVKIPRGDHLLIARDLAEKAVASPPVKLRSEDSDKVPSITWVKLGDGATFMHDVPILLEVQAVDPRGLFFHVDFFADGRAIGGSDFNCPECRPALGAVLIHRFEWSGAPVGKHLLHAAAFDAAGGLVTSRRIQIEVLPTPGPQFSAWRTLPDSFVAGQKFTVRVDVKVSDSVQNYVVEDRPPFAQIGGAPPPLDHPRWNVTAVSHDGVFDGVTGTVKFGPFFDREPRQLTYEITPNEAEVDFAEFAGRIVVDGVVAETGGDQVLPGNRHHPADRDPANDAIDALELTSYGAAWKSGREWVSGPNPIPMEYVTRAALLWRLGERYRLDSAVGPAPLWWVSDPLLPPTPPPEGSTAFDSAGQPRFRGLALRSETPATTDSKVISVRVYPAPGTKAYAVEERVAGTPVGVTGEGSYDATAKTIRWGPFLDQVPRTLRYRLDGVAATHPAQGIASFDGTQVKVQPGLAPEFKGPHLVCVESMKDGGRQVVLEDGELLAGAGYELEVSSDLHRWKRAGDFVNVHTAGFARDDAPANGAPLFYRAVRVK